MITLKSFQAWNWRNRLADHPVAVADIDEGASWGADRLSQGVLAAITDPIYASVTAGSAVAFVNGLIARPRITASELALSLSQFVDGCEFAALDQSSRAMVAAAGRRGIPWRRVSLG